MSLKFHPLKVRKIVEETPDAVSVHLEKPSEEFKYIPGQYLTLKIKIGGEELRRAYSLCSDPGEDEDLVVTIKRMHDGRVSNFIPDHIKTGDTIEVYPPMGKFTVQPDPERTHHYVLVGGGSGITPLMSIIRSVLRLEPSSKVTLVYGNRNLESIIFREKLDWLEDQYGDRIRIIHSLDEPPADWMGIKGRMTSQILMPLFQGLLGSDKMSKTFHLCGPGPMMEEAKSALKFLGVDQKNIRQELFTVALPQEQEPQPPGLREPQPPELELKRDTYQVTVILDGKERQITVPPDRSILDIAIQEGLDPPFACQLGICTTCRAMCRSGAVEMDESEGLTDEEIDDGYVLTCQSHPLSEGVIVEYR